MRSNFLILFTLLAASMGLSGCSGPSVPNSNNGNTANSNTTAGNANNPLGTTKKPEVATTNNAPTIAPVVEAYYDALRRKDDSSVRKVLTDEFLKSIEADMKEEKKTGMAAYLAEYDTIPTKAIEVRNEKIDGENAVAEIKGGAYINWTSFAFKKENGLWKFTGGSADIDSVQKSTNSSK